MEHQRRRRGGRGRRRGEGKGEANANPAEQAQAAGEEGQSAPQSRPHRPKDASESAENRTDSAAKADATAKVDAPMQAPSGHASEPDGQ